MYRKASNFTFKASTLIALLLLLGCTISPKQAADTDSKIEIVSSKHLVISNVVMVEKPGGFSLKGDVRDKHSLEPTPRGHIDIDVIDDKSRVLHKTRTAIHRFGNVKRPKSRYKFSIEVPYIAPTGSVIRVSYHDTTLH